MTRSSGSIENSTSIQVDRWEAYDKDPHTSKKKVHYIYIPTLALLSFCFSLLIITMCQLSKCFFSVRVQRTDELCDDRESTQKQQQRLCQICNRNRWGNN